MQEKALIAVSEFCTVNQIAFSFVNSLNEFGLIEIVDIDNDKFVAESQLLALEKIIRMHDEFGINLEGIETVNHLLEKINSLQSELTSLKNRLRFYEDFE
jgi:hypothetical protein